MPPRSGPAASTGSRCAGRCRSASRAPSARGATPTPDTAACRCRRSWPRPSNWHGTASRPGTASSGPSRRRRRTSSARSAPTPGSWPSIGRTAGGGGRASGSDCRPWPRRSRRWPTDGTDAFYDGDLGERQAAAWRRPAVRSSRRTCAATPALGRSDLDRLPRRPRHDPPPNSSGLVALEILAILERFEAPGRRRLRADRRHGSGLDPPRDRGVEARDGRSRRVPHRPGVRDVPVASCSTPSGSPGSPTRIDPRRAARPARRRTRPAAARSTSRSSIATATR